MRGPFGVQPTQAGTVLLEHSARILSAVSDAEAELTRLHASGEVLRVATFAERRGDPATRPAGAVPHREPFGRTGTRERRSGRRRRCCGAARWARPPADGSVLGLFVGLVRSMGSRWSGAESVFTSSARPYTNA
ncbi:LysR family transcriptional regulator [Nocardia puris]|uniref:LysR family transcriptional regulator n=1 Tax=Nocardia puris TaxID=208602 RepID=UPI00082E73FF|nr:LysR family transcriptional regulator [Nocardia puris]